MNKIDDERLRKLAHKLGYSCEELSAKGIEAMLEWIEGKDEKRMPDFILEIREKQKKLNKDNNSENGS